MEVLLSAGTYYAITKGTYYSQTAYALMKGGCVNQCKFCSQPLSNNADKSYLSRVKWYSVSLEAVKDKLSTFKRFCLQTVVKPGFEDEVVKIVSEVQKISHNCAHIHGVPEVTKGEGSGLLGRWNGHNGGKLGERGETREV